MMIFGPVPSRRLGKSLGINNIPPKYCSYSCVYCQVGRTTNMQVHRKTFYDPQEIKSGILETVARIKERGGELDYLTFVADGEPTLDINLGLIIDELKETGIKVAVISNSSLIWREDVRKDLLLADWVSLKCDAITDNKWKQINRPHGKLKKNEILEGIKKFTEIFSGQLVTETMLVKGINDKPEELEEIASFLSTVGAKNNYISIPTRPPAETNVFPPGPEILNTAYQIFKDRGLDVECLLKYEGNDFAGTGDIKRDILSITSVHPLKQEAVEELLKRNNASTEEINTLLAEKKIVRVNYRGDTFYIKNFSN